MAPGQPADRDNRGEPDWSDLVKRIQARTYLSQKQIADRCRVARQTVSAWVHRRRSPGLYAKRELIALAVEANVRDAAISGGAPTDVGQLGSLLTQLSPEGRKEVLEFAKFKLSQEGN